MGAGEKMTEWYREDYRKEWYEMLKLFKDVKGDLSQIPLVCKEGMYASRTDKGNSEDNH